MLEAFLQDIRYGLRLFRAGKGFSATVVLTLGLGIGANTAIFSVVDAAVLQGLPFTDADRLRFVNGVATSPDGVQIRGLSYPDYRDFAERVRTLEGLAAVSPSALNLEGADGAERLQAEIVSASYFDLLRVRPHLGRLFGPEEDREPQARPVALLGYGLWQRAFAGDPDIVGSTLRLNGRELAVVGVLPEGFSGVTLDAEIWVPTMMVSLMRDPEILEDRSERWLLAVGRLVDGIEPALLEQDLDRIGRDLEAAYPETNSRRGAQAQELRDAYLGNVERALVALLASVGGVMLIACANVTNLLLARSASRSGEVAVRRALGARRGRLFRQLLTESVVLALAGGGAGILIALWSLGALETLIPPGLLPSYVQLSLDTHVFLFTFAVTIAAGVLSGLAPALSGSRHDLAPSIRAGSRNASAPESRRLGLRLRGFLVTAQVALTVALLVCAGVMIRSLWLQLDEEPGFEPQGLVAFRITLPPEAYDHDERLRFLAELEREITELVPAGTGIAFASDLPFRGITSAGFLWRDRDPAEPTARIRYNRHAVSPSFFEVLGVELLEGRRFTAADRRDAAPVVIVGAATARRLWPGERSVIGNTVRFDADGAPWSVVGVVQDIRYRSLTDDLMGTATDPELYFATGQRTASLMELVVAADADPAPTIGVVREAVTRIDPTIPVDAVAGLEEALAAQTAMSRLQSILLSSFGVLGLILGAAGISGLLAHAVARRQKEIGIRLAMGAAPREIGRAYLRRGLGLALPGIVLGLLLGVQGATGMRNLLFGVGPADPLALGAAVIVVLAAAAAASWLPARRAAAIDPAATLRAE